MIVRCLDAADVSAAVMFARRSGLPLAVRGGGHSFAGLSVCDGGVVVDLGPMKQIRVDPERRAVQAEAGVLLGELDRATQAYGLAVPTGSVTHTGLAGLTLGGGIGWLMRRYGLTVDQLLSVEVVTADGEVLRANRPRTPTCSGVFAAAAATSGSSPASSSGSTPSDRWSTPASCSGRSTRERRWCAATATGRTRPRTS